MAYLRVGAFVIPTLDLGAPAILDEDVIIVGEMVLPALDLGAPAILVDLESDAAVFEIVIDAPLNGDGAAGTITAGTIAAGQVGKVLRLRTGQDLTGSTNRILEWIKPDGTTVTRTGVPADTIDPADMLYTIQAGDFDDLGVYAVTVEAQYAGGVKIRPDAPISLNVDNFSDD